MAARSYRYVAGLDCEFFQKGAAKKAAYRVADHKDSRALARFLSGEEQALLPMLELIEQAEMAVDELIDVAGRATIEAVLTLSAQELAGPRESACSCTPRWYDRQRDSIPSKSRGRTSASYLRRPA